jgi:hypothetical protein
VVAVRRTAGHLLIIDECPYCGGKHLHGSGGEYGIGLR